MSTVPAESPSAPYAPRRPRTVTSWALPIHWISAMGALAVIALTGVTGHHLTETLTPLAEDATEALRAAERTEREVAELAADALPTLGLLMDVQKLAGQYVKEFELLAIEPERGTAGLEETIRELNARAEVLAAADQRSIDSQTVHELLEIVHVFIDITEEAAGISSPNQLRHLTLDSHDMLAELQGTIDAARAQMAGFTDSAASAVVGATARNRENVERQRKRLSGFQDLARTSMAMLAIAVLVAMLLLQWVLSRRLGRLRAYVGRVAAGRYDAELAAVAKDRVGEVAVDVQRMATSLARLVRESEAQAESARRAREQTERQSWLNTALRTVFESTRGELELDTLARRALGAMAEQTGAVAGLFYGIGDSTLVPLAGYATPLPDTGPVPLGVGLAGQAALERRTKVLSSPCESGATPGPGLLSGPPAAVYVHPIILNGELKGVLELGLQARPDDDTARFFDLASDHLGICLRAVEQRRETQHAFDELRKQSELLEARGEELRRAVESATKASEAKSEFLARMSHEIRTPLNGVLGMVELMLKSPLQARERGFAQTIQRSGEALLAVINDILDFSKIEAGQLSLNAGLVDLRELVEEMGEVFAASAARKGVELVCRFPVHAPRRFRGDATRLRQVLTNLVGNALKFTEAGEVVLSVDTVDAEGGMANVEVSVRDTGIGIPEEDQARVFDSFAQADGSSTRAHGGTGLGLAISQRLAQLMGGGIELESRPGKGSTFRLTVRLELDDAHVPSDHPRPLRGTSVLVVDDNETNREVLQQQLSGWGADCRLAADGPSALDALDTGGAADVVVLDMHMPRMDGLGLARAIRAQARFADCALMILSSVSDALDAVQLRDLGIAFHLTKPVRQAELLDCLGALSRTPRDARPAPTPAPRTLACVPDAAGDEVRLDGRVLLAEDHPVNQATAVEMLRLMGLEVDVVETGREAVEAWATGRYDLVLMDWQMPEMDGTEASREIRRREEAAGGYTPIVAVTANALAGDREACLAAGMDAYLGKPFRWAELEQVVREFLPEKDRATGPPADARAPCTSAAVTADAGREPAASAPLDETVLGEIRAMDARGEGGFMARLFANYRKTSREDVGAIQDAAAADDGDTVRRAAHRLKSASRNVGGLRLAALCQALEARARDGQIVHADELIHAIGAEHLRVEQALAGHCGKAA